ncbi:MAG: AAA family ATPase [Sulfurimonas sp.]|jgi:cellulose biosynthesis protein BcsQ
MCIKIAFFNHKGGVSKTTTVFNVGWMLASKGKKVIMVDADSQCNLTGMVMGFQGLEELDETKDNIKAALSPAFESRPKLIEPVNCFEIENREHLYLLPGNIKFAEYDITLGMAQTISDSIVTLKNLPGSINYLLDKTAEKYDADYILIDMSPSLSSINQNLFMICDYFIIPSSPDYFSLMALDSLSNVLPKWYKQSLKLQENEILQDAEYKFPNKTPKFLGNIIQNFNVRSNKPTLGFKKWFDEINTLTSNKFVPILEKDSMLIRKECYPAGCLLAEIPNFNSLIAYSQEHNIPVFALTAAKIKRSGAAWTSAEKNITEFEKVFAKLADDIIRMTDAEC